jgi:hypothetical protein
MGWLDRLVGELSFAAIKSTKQTVAASPDVAEFPWLGPGTRSVNQIMKQDHLDFDAAYVVFKAEMNPPLPTIARGGELVRLIQEQSKLDRSQEVGNTRWLALQVCIANSVAATTRQADLELRAHQTPTPMPPSPTPPPVEIPIGDPEPEYTPTPYRHKDSHRRLGV